MTEQKRGIVSPERFIDFQQSLSDFKILYNNGIKRGLTDGDLSYERNYNYMFGEGKWTVGGQCNIPLAQEIYLKNLPEALKYKSHVFVCAQTLLSETKHIVECEFCNGTGSRWNREKVAEYQVLPIKEFTELSKPDNKDGMSIKTVNLSYFGKKMNIKELANYIRLKQEEFES